MMNSKGKFICTTCRSLHVQVFREMGTCRDCTTYSCSICNNKHRAVDGEPGSTFIKRNKCDFNAIEITKKEYIEIIKIEHNKHIISKISDDHKILFIYNNVQKCWYIIVDLTIRTDIYLPEKLYNHDYNIIEELNFHTGNIVKFSIKSILFLDVIDFFNIKKSDSSKNHRISPLLIEKRATDISND